MSKLKAEIKLPGGSTLSLYHLGVYNDEFKVEYHLTPKGVYAPILKGCFFLSKDIDCNSDKFILDLLGAVFYGSKWTAQQHEIIIQDPQEFTNKQVEWLTTPEVDPLMDLLEDYEDDGLIATEIYDQDFKWIDDKLYYIDSSKRVFKNISLN
jgi:hypothetical protein